MLTPEQREERRKFIGSSDASAVLGLNPYKSAYDVWLEKMHRTKDIDDSDAVEVGNALEPSILDWGAAKMGVVIVKNPAPVIHANGFMASRPDAIIPDLKEAFEAKASGVVSYLTKEWGAIETDEVPKQYNIQGLHHLACLGSEWGVCHYPALLGGVGLRMYHVERDEESIGYLEEILGKFHRDYILGGVPPDDSIPTMDVVKRILRMPSKIVQVPADLITKWNDAKEAAKVASGELDIAKATLIAALGDAEAGESEAGGVTYFEQKRKAYEVKESSYRVLREAKVKAKGAQNAA